MAIRDKVSILLDQIKDKVDNLPTDPADQSTLAGLISDLETAISGLFDVPTADSTANDTVTDVVGNKTDTTGGDSVYSLLLAIKAKTDTIT